MNNYQFDFQKFSIIQQHSAMKIGTDGVLLGAWTTKVFKEYLSAIKDESHLKVLDIGTGTGLLALMIAQCFPNAEIDAIEIDHDSAEEAKMNITNSEWSDRINVMEISLEDYRKYLSDNYEKEEKQYSLIITNPPFYNATLKPEDESRAKARHYDSLPFSDITSFCDKHLCSTGLLSVIFPTNVEQNILNGIRNSTLNYRNICDIFTKEGKTPKRRMITLTKNDLTTEFLESLIIRDKDNNYSKKYKELTKEFYLP